MNTSLRNSPIFTNNPDYDAEERVRVWVASAQCMQKTGLPLVVCGSSGGVVPIEEWALADDRGHALLANVVAHFKKEPFTAEDLTKINLWITAVGVFLLSLMLGLSGMPLSSLLFLLMASRKAIPGPIPGPDVPSSYIGIISLGLVPVVFLYSRIFRSLSRNKVIFGWALSLLCLAAACLLRQPIGIIGVMLCLSVLLGRCLGKTCRGRLGCWLRQGVLAVLIAGTLWGSSLLLVLRGAFYKIPPAPRVAAHGFWHTFYHGLGTRANPWGIEWRDAYGYRLARQIDPTIVYSTPPYFKLMRKLYLTTVAKNPLDVLKIYFLKLVEIISQPFRILGINIYSWALAVLFLLPLLMVVTPIDKAWPLHIVAGLEGALFLFILQGVVGIPWLKHLYPAKMIVLLQLMCLSDYLWLMFKSRFSIISDAIGKFLPKMRAS
ncbi:MAG: hypothetical protein LHV69_05475 [Elusimicrobia bacterium]|nr:hypothetical protein [Candidatus Obscuribacterium magneticum]